MGTLQDFVQIPTKDLLLRFLEEAPKIEGRERSKLQRKLLSDPLNGLWDLMSQGMQGFSGYQLLRLGMLFDPDDDLREIRAAYDALTTFAAWDKVDEALRSARKYFGGPACSWALMIADRTKPDIVERFKGYTGFGSIPPYIILSIWPTTYSLIHLKSSASREYQHQMRALLFPIGGMSFDLAAAVINEGLAEVFVEEQYGESFISEIAQNLTLDQVKKIWPKYRENLKVTGMDRHRPFLFGGYGSDLPYCAGFAVGYQLVKGYQQKHPGTTSRELISIPAQKIIQGSVF